MDQIHDRVLDFALRRQYARTRSAGDQSTAALTRSTPGNRRRHANEAVPACAFDRVFVPTGGWESLTHVGSFPCPDCSIQRATTLGKRLFGIR